MKIIPASIEHAQQIHQLTLRSFELYKAQLANGVEVAALNEKLEDVIYDINNNMVIAAVKHAQIIGSIRIERLTQDLAYIYRFAVSTESSGTGWGLPFGVRDRGMRRNGRQGNRPAHQHQVLQAGKILLWKGLFCPFHHL